MSKTLIIISVLTLGGGWIIGMHILVYKIATAHFPKKDKSKQC